MATNKKVGSSNLSGRTIFFLLFLRFRMLFGKRRCEPQHVFTLSDELPSRVTFAVFSASLGMPCCFFLVVSVIDRSVSPGIGSRHAEGNRTRSVCTIVVETRV